MFNAILTKIVGSKNDRDLKQIAPIVQQINALEPEMAGRSNAQLAELTPKFRERLGNGEPLDDLLPEAFAAVREVSKRILNMRHFDVQLIGGVFLHRGRIAEMKTGEGKTLVATFLHISTLWMEKAFTLSQLTITWLVAMRTGWARSFDRLV
jgi:preprotein translocase subunit SecA